MVQPTSKKSLQLKKIVIVLFIVVFLASIWPIAPIFSKIHPMVLGLPFSLVYLIILLAFSFSVLLCLYIWESRAGKVE